MRALLARIRRPPWRAPALALAILAPIGIAYAIWSPGEDDRSGRHDRRLNGIWMQHGWLGDDAWFVENGKVDRMPELRDQARIAKMLHDLRSHGVTDLFPHLCPASDDGSIAPHDDAQIERFLDAAAAEQGSWTDPMRVLPWIGGRRESTAHVEDPAWRRAFVASARGLLEEHPRLAGVHANIEPWRDGDAAGLALLDELRAGLPPGKLLSVSGYPPPTIWHPFRDVHWQEPYFREVSRRCDQIAVMAYDTALRQEKIYRWLVASWTRDVIAWSEGADILIGVPTYDDSGTPWHVPRVENLENALLGIHAGLGLGGEVELPARYQGVAIYSDWETSEDEWRQLSWMLSARKPDYARQARVGFAAAFLACVGIGWGRSRRDRFQRLIGGAILLVLAGGAWLAGLESAGLEMAVLPAIIVGLGLIAGSSLSMLVARLRTPPGPA